MNRALRQWHLKMVTGLAPVAAIMFIGAVLVRRHAPINPVPAALVNVVPEGKEVSRAIIRGQGLMLEARLLSQDHGMVLQISPLSQTLAADVLVYLGKRGSSNLADARLLGPLSGPGPVRFTIPPDSRAGTLLFYSPAIGRLLAQDSVRLAE